MCYVYVVITSFEAEVVNLTLDLIVKDICTLVQNLARVVFIIATVVVECEISVQQIVIIVILVECILVIAVKPTDLL